MSHTIGIIGGADGPTAIFVTGNSLPAIVAPVILIAAVILIVCIFRKKK